MARKKIMYVSFIGFILAVIFGFFMLPMNKVETASAAEALTSRITQSGFFIEEGASVRVNGNTYAENGLRYTIGMEKAAYDSVMAENSGYTDITFGVLIAPASSKYNLTPESVFGLNGGTVKYDWAVEDENGNLTYNGDGTKTRIINIQTDKLFNVKDRDGEDYYFHGSVINVNKNNLTREFQGKGYVRFKYNGVDGCIMLGNETNVRSIVYVSQLAVEANSEHSTWLKQNYIDAVGSVSANYTEENYLEQADGSFVVDAGTKKTISSTINASVSLGAAPSFSGYVFDEADERNVISGKVFVNDKLALKRYYRLGYPTSSLNVGTAAVNVTSLSVAANNDKKQTLISNVGENYAAVTMSSSTITGAGFYAFALNLAGTATDVWNADLSVQFTPNGWFLTSGNINTDANRIVSFKPAIELKNSTQAFTLVYKSTYCGNEYYTNGMQLELWIAQHDQGANLEDVAFTRLEIAGILNSAKVKIQNNKLVVKYDALTQEKFIPDFTLMIQQGWNTSCSWDVNGVQILTAAPMEAEKVATVLIPAGTAPTNTDALYTLAKDITDEYVSVTLNAAYSGTEYLGLGINLLGSVSNDNMWAGGLILRIGYDGVVLWNGGINEGYGTPLAQFTPGDITDVNSPFTLVYHFDFSQEGVIGMELYGKKQNGELNVFTPIAMANGVTYENEKYYLDSALCNYVTSPDCTLIILSALNTGCTSWTVSGVSLTKSFPTDDGYKNPVNGNATTLSLTTPKSVAAANDEVVIAAQNVNESYMAVTLQATGSASASYYAVGLNLLGSTSGWDGGIVLRISKDSVSLRNGGINSEILLADLDLGNITDISQPFTVAYKLSFGDAENSDRVGIELWAANVGTAFKRMGCVAVQNGCTYDEASQQFIIPYSMLTQEQYVADCSLIFLGAFNNQNSQPCSWEIQDVEILSGSPDELSSYWANPAYVGISLDDSGTMYLGQTKVYMAGVNMYDLFTQCWSDGNASTKAKAALDIAKANNLKVVRFNCGAYGYEWVKHVNDNAAAMLQLMKEIAAYAEDLEIGLIPSFFWCYNDIPDYVDEPINRWGVSGSATRTYMVNYTTAVVNALKGYQSIFGWEFGNEFNLSCDLGKYASENRPALPANSSRSSRTSEDDLTLSALNAALTEFASTINGLDISSRMIGSGNAAPRAEQYSLYVNGGWDNWDTDAEYQTVTNVMTPCNTISEHIYFTTRKYSDGTYSLANYFARAVQVSKALGKGFYVGEWGWGSDSAQSDYENESYYTSMANAIVEAGVQLALLWNFNAVEGSVEYSFSADTTRGKMLLSVLADTNAAYEAKY